MSRVGLVLVSHSAKVAEGVTDLVRQMAPDVVIEPAGGMGDGGLGTSYDLVLAALTSTLEACGAVVVIADLGSAVLTVESVLDMEDLTDQVLLADAPFVEGAVAAGVAAQGEAAAAQVRAAAEAAADLFVRHDVVEAGDGQIAGEPAPAATQDSPEPGSGPDGVVRSSVVLRNRLGLHARPAAVLARIASEFDAQVTLNGVDAASVLALMTLGVVGGQEVTVEAVGAQAQEASAAVTGEIEGGFGET